MLLLNKGGTMPEETKAKREAQPEQILKVFDNTFKYLLRYASPQALLRFINKQFGRDFPLNSRITFDDKESQSVKQSGDLKNIIADMIIVVTPPVEPGLVEESFLFEVQITDDENMARRVMNYAYANVVLHSHTDDTGRLIMPLPDAKVFFLEHTKKTPNRLDCTLTYKQNTRTLDFEIGVVKILDYTVDGLVEDGLTLLLPFYLLKLRRDVQKARGAEELGTLADKLMGIMTEMEKAIEGELALGHVWAGDAKMLIERMYYLLRRLYDKYPEIKEKTMSLIDEFDTYWEGYLPPGYIREEATASAVEFMLSLAKKGYTEAQMRAEIAKAYPGLAIA
jgi:hypothetical protein